MRARMIDRIIEFSAHHRFLILALAFLAALAGWRSMMRTPLDALPEMGDKQVIVFSRWDRSPDLIDSQVTYPIVSALLGAPRVKSVRGISDYGSSFVYVIFEDDTDLYWARSRTIEYLSGVLPRLPAGVKTELGPDATALGWIFQYVLIDRSGKHSLTDLRSYQDWYLSFYLRSVGGVAEVASVGGLVRQYQVNVDPHRLRAFGISVQQVAEAVRRGNRDESGQVVESGGSELMVRGLGYAHSIEDLGEILLSTADDGTPIRVKEVAQVAIGSEFRRGVTDFDGTGEVVSGIVVMRHGQNAQDVIRSVKDKLREIQPSLPAGMEVLPVYDRSDLVRRSVHNLKSTILEVILTVSFVVLVFLWHVPSAVVPLITVPLAVLISFIPFQMLGITANIMSLGGIAIAIGALVDAAIVAAEQTHKKLEQWDWAGRPGEQRSVVLDAVKQVARPSFFALLVIAVSFLPILTLDSEEGSLFRPLAFTKSLSMLIAACLAITLTPALRLLFTRSEGFGFRPYWLCRVANFLFVGQIHAEERHLISRVIIRCYEPVVAWTLNHPRFVALGAVILMITTVPAWRGLGTEFMPALDEGTLLYMPTTMPGISIGEAQRLLQETDNLLKQFPEVDHVLGKAGRADTSTDPAPLSMVETIVTLRPTAAWRQVPVWYSSWAPAWAASIFRHITADHISREDLGQPDECRAPSAGCRQHLDHADPRADRHAFYWYAIILGPQNRRGRCLRNRTARRGSRGAANFRAGHARGVCGTAQPGKLRRSAVESRSVSPQWADARGRPSDRAVCHWGRECHGPRDRARTLSGERPILTRFPWRFRGPAARSRTVAPRAASNSHCGSSGGADGPGPYHVAQ
jgi:Cu(I)/Ag(I) efflux system membrane protein CusA/SilA